MLCDARQDDAMRCDAVRCTCTNPNQTGQDCKAMRDMATCVLDSGKGQWASWSWQRAAQDVSRAVKGPAMERLVGSGAAK